MTQLRFLYCLGLMLLGSAPLVAVADCTGGQNTVRQHIQAFNQGDADALAANVIDEFAWYGLSGPHMRTEVRGRGAFRSAMKDYFAAVPSVRSSAGEMLCAGDFISFKETVSWRSSEGEERSQSALAVYEVTAELIARAWYFEATGQ